MGRSKWENFKPIRQERPNAGLVTRVLILVFFLLGGMFLGLVFALYLLGEAALHSNSFAVFASLHWVAYLFIGGGGVFGVGFAGYWMWQHDREDRLRREEEERKRALGQRGPLI